MGKLLIFLILTRITIFFSLFLINNEFVPSVFSERWDGNSYRFITENGYQTKENAGSEFIVFLPLYPTILRSLNFINLPTASIAFIVSNTFFVIGSLSLYKLLLVDYGERFSRKVVASLALFPTSYFFSVGYPESLFLFTTTASLYLARRNNFLLGFIFAGLATITRPTGIFLFPTLIYLILVSKENRLKKLFSATPGLLFPVYYLLVNYKLHQDFLAFKSFLETFWQKAFDLPWKGIIKSFKLTNYKDWTLYQKLTIGLGEGLASASGWIFSALAIFLRAEINLAYSVFTILSVALFTSTGFILSSPRYLLSIFPFFIVLCLLLKNKLIFYAWLVVSSVLLIFYSNHFYLGHWAF
ncbi:hypothetical protein A3D84_03435 [Candidatus Woesebacteria bacterium RIFCSPHIGHO2_02_FULL_42_20]|uniref:Glycosyltransferase RgtA/B/C/D-like domain-containing protein n=1 Tax=Candidatus Woesebacteria bacterium RIFCSPHIGHO2_12_FULL_41_24 TaxID=1802510 RepID=A0A1F8AVB3_9BACT|nr:MAG: hypothetical protein A2W15_03585 [Candidatus Woesebacteria bacterium RBG_16_41_13]OGM29610.1 MAG: hypothetical protein A2873_03610 [Candidatus Woesebacteria bacterium RIFCSPHIGHO2_01_FULL_42_80]OGM35586.1 MAG: hypothetical protein A3D84_03435 [Candidatus Woesebacteria bacterium RIFCSPHIGHO2_02_FULL_42_20]OGM55198.1 MAG: hypothetical protein A3E44_02845 [Candidatus Woesebacteria bacterium RIFCSPHIGHO2_12_FULL_41_24]OGM67152.1 MAG: hypothetical protein A2969_04570 [Candidatus Woesebacteri